MCPSEVDWRPVVRIHFEQHWSLLIKGINDSMCEQLRRGRTLPTTPVKTQAHDQFRTRDAGSNVTLNSCMTIVSRLDERRCNVRRCLSIILVEWGIMSSLGFPPTYVSMKSLVGVIDI